MNDCSVFYWHDATSRTQWEKPVDDIDNIPLPAGWECKSLNGRKYYIDHNNRITTWIHPLRAQAAPQTSQSARSSPYQQPSYAASSSVPPAMSSSQRHSSSSSASAAAAAAAMSASVPVSTTPAAVANQPIKPQPGFQQGSQCSVCSTSFSMVVWAHHCRCCGLPVCGKCSRNRMKLPQYGVGERVRVCDDCFRNTTVPARLRAVQLCEEMGFGYVQIKKSIRVLENTGASVFDVNMIIEGISHLPAEPVAAVVSSSSSSGQRKDVGAGNQPKESSDSDSEELASAGAAASAAAAVAIGTGDVPSAAAAVATAPAEAILPPKGDAGVAAVAVPSAPPQDSPDNKIGRAASMGGSAPLAPPDADICKICFDAPYECIILECGHICSCMECSNVFLKTECPICRVKVTRVVKFFKV